jgi:hypothetical protein
MWHYNTFVTPQVFQFIGPSIDGRSHACLLTNSYYVRVLCELSLLKKSQALQKDGNYILMQQPTFSLSSIPPFSLIISC